MNVYKTQNCHTFGATAAAAECMSILRFVNIQKGPLFSDIEPLEATLSPQGVSELKKYLSR